MKRLFVLYIFLLFSAASFAQKKDSSDNTQEKNKQQDTRYQEGSSGVTRSISYKFSNTITDNDPGNGIFRYNKDDITGITYIILDDIDLSGEGQRKWYSTWDKETGATGRGRINIVEYEGKNVNVFDVTGVFVEEDGYWKIPVEYVSGSLPADGITYYYIFERIENKDKNSKEDKTSVEETVAVAAVVTAAVVVTEPTPDPQPAPAPEPVAEAKEEPVVKQEPVAEKKEEPVSQPEPVKEESKVEETVAVAAVVTAAAVVTEPTPDPQPAPVVEEKKEEPAPAPQPEPVAEAKEEPVVQQEPVAEKKEEPVSQPEPVKEESKVEETVAVAAAVTVAATVAEPKPEPMVRTSQQSQPKQESKPAQPTQQEPVSQPKTTSQPSQQQPAPVKKETPASQPAPKTNQPAPKPAQPQSRPAQPQTSPNTSYPSSGTGSSVNVFTKKSDGSRIFHGIIETGYGFKVSDYGINNYRINFIGSFSLGQHFMIGLGLGYRSYFDKPEKHTDWYLVSGKSQVPVFLDLRYLFTKKQLTPYVALGIGGSTEKSVSDTTTFGSFVNPSAGIWYRLSKNTALFAGVAYEGIEMEFAKPVDNIPFRRKNNSLSLNIGIQF